MAAQRAYEAVFGVGLGQVRVTVIAPTPGRAITKAARALRRDGYREAPKFSSLTALPRLVP